MGREVDWRGFWPVVDSCGVLTGAITEENMDYVTVENTAKIKLVDLPSATRADILAARARTEEKSVYLDDTGVFVIDVSGSDSILIGLAARTAQRLG